MNKIKPPKGIDIIAIDSEGNEHYCYACACNDDKCKAFKCSVTRSLLMIDVKSWKYLKEWKSLN